MHTVALLLEMEKAKVYVIRKYFDGLPKHGDLELIEEDLPPLNDGEFVAEALYLGLDPFFRLYSQNLPLGSTFPGSQVARIIESRNPEYTVGRYVHGYFGWRTLSISNGQAIFQKPYIIPDFGELPLSLALGVLGITGVSAYAGFLDICKPKAGETVVVTAAAGAVGNHVGQIAKMKGCKVIGIAGSDEKGRWLTEELGFDRFINYKTDDVEQALKESAPEGVDCYFDNVGGDISFIVMNQMNRGGRISVCGSISEYNETKLKSYVVQMTFILKELVMEGFFGTRWMPDEYHEIVNKNLELIQKRKLKYKETITEGFENIPEAFLSVFSGKNFGKAVVKV